ncbi:phospholipase D family protein [Ectobacillus sp. sgz5001026]|uniref:phospholipase D family protein n=1 Tax=Ectobacillus sp. sgz5001026 TaxID=3242473 RepID=UPI0036D3E1C4
MKLVTNNLEKHLFEELNKSRESIMIISPFISMYTAERLLNKLRNDNVECILITRFDRNLFINGNSSIEALKLLKRQGVKIIALKNLHSKVYILDENVCITGSANFTKKGLKENKELLMFLYKQHEIIPILSYAKQLLEDILMSGHWYVNEDMINIEIEMKNHLKSSIKQDARMNYSWGAELLNNNSLDEEAIVLSVSIGGTYDIVETLEIDISDWKRVIEERDFSEAVKNRLVSYIIERKNGFNYEKSVPYKFYILNERYELHNCPRPPKNNTGGWYYSVGDLLSAEDIVYTIKV